MKICIITSISGLDRTPIFSIINYILSNLFFMLNIIKKTLNKLLNLNHIFLEKKLKKKEYKYKLCIKHNIKGLK